MSILARFLESRRTDATKEVYQRNIKLLVGDPDAYLQTARMNRTRAEDFLISKIAEWKGGVSGATIYARVAMLKSFLDWNEVSLNWKRVKATAPRARMISLDRGPLIEEVRKALEYASPRQKVVLLFMLSGGLRVGAFEYLTLGHVKRLESGIGLIRVYAGEPEEYSTFVSKEAMDAVDVYLDERVRRAFEKIIPASPVVRDNEYQKAKLRHASTKTIQLDLWSLWIRCGVRQIGVKAEFKLAHGARKSFRTNLGKAGISPDDCEILLGHFLNYYKPTLEHLEEEYLKAEPFLTVSESAKLRRELTDKEKSHDSEWTKTRLELLEAKEKQRTMEEDMKELKKHWETMQRMRALAKEKFGVDL